MSVITPTEISVEEIPMNVVYGTSKRRARLYVRATATAAADEVYLQTYVPNLSNVEGIAGYSIGGSARATYTSGSAGVNFKSGGTTLQFDSINGVYEVVANVVMD